MGHSSIAISTAAAFRDPIREPSCAARAKRAAFAEFSVHSGLASALSCGVDDLLGVPQRKRDILVDDSLKLDEYSI
jgi:hypothetical protein